MSTLALENINVSAGEKPVVRGVSLSISQGEVHVLLGPNGSGKSTLVNAVMGHPKYVVTAGKFVLDGEDILSLPPEEKAKKGIFLSMQYLPEIPGVTLNNFLYASYQSHYPQSQLSIIDFYQLAEARAKEAGIDPVFLKRQVGAGLSGGEKKQTEMLQAVVLEPRFALLDEIDSGVDVDAMSHIIKAIDRLRSHDTGVLLITHYDTILRHITPDHVHVMKEGVIVADGGTELAEKIRSGGFTVI